MIKDEEKKKLSFREYLQVFTIVAAIFMALASGFIALKLNPLAQNIELNKIAIAESRYRDDKIWKELEYLRDKIDKIYYNTK